MSPEKGWAVVTGASAGIGAEFARALARRGHPILAVARRADRLKALAEEIGREGGRLEPCAEDLSAPSGPARVAERALALGDVELLVNNAGFGSHGVFVELPLDRELEMIRLNVAAVVELTHRLLPGMIARRAGGVINVASTAGFQPVPYFATYAATKAFVIEWTHALSEELRQHRVRILASCPGATESEFHGVAGTAELVKKSPTMMSAAALVADALDAFDRGRVVKVAGFWNAFGALLGRISPRPVVRTVAGRIFRPRTPAALPPATR
jgi:short-subunit dehydrogenase